MRVLGLASILIVDDDEDILDLYRETLEYRGYSVETSRTGLDAIEKAEKNKYQIALLDVVLPDIRGEKVAEKLKKIDESMEIIFITGYSLFQACIEATNIGICDILLKPITEEELLLAVENALPAQ
ncbi:response regulator [Candidatus Bathyarchaeota archaeon]|nr:response regulator [Candidatus Bathyarchaeota archaeon]